MILPSGTSLLKPLVSVEMRVLRMEFFPSITFVFQGEAAPDGSIVTRRREFYSPHCFALSSVA